MDNYTGRPASYRGYDFSSRNSSSQTALQVLREMYEFVTLLESLRAPDSERSRAKWPRNLTLDRIGYAAAQFASLTETDNLKLLCMCLGDMVEEKNLGEDHSKKKEELVKVTGTLCDRVSGDPLAVESGHSLIIASMGFAPPGGPEY